MSTGPGDLTAEIRWWWPGKAPPEVSAWFEAGEPGAMEERVDTYALTGTGALGVKRRGEGKGLEVKALVATLDDPGASGPAQLWIKHTASSYRQLPEGSQVEVAKRRCQRCFLVEDGMAREVPLANPGHCTLELAAVRAGEEHWASVALEAQASIRSPLAILAPVLALTGPPPSRGEALLASYPAWLARLARI